MSKQVTDCKLLADAYALQFRDMGNGHVQFSGRGVLVNYWPLSKKRTAHCPETGRKETNCTPYDAVRMCLQGKASHPLKAKAKVTKNRPMVEIAPVCTNPAGLKHFYSGDLPPWDESLPYQTVSTDSDAIRMSAYEIESRCSSARWVADEIDHRTGL